MTSTNEPSLTSQESNLSEMSATASQNPSEPNVASKSPQDAINSPQDAAIISENPVTASQRSPEVVPSTVTNDQPAEAEPMPDPKVTALLAMFPDFDATLLQSVLESVAGDQDRAIDVLLGMSDPSYTSNHPNATQTELDEQMARQLMLEESAQQTAWPPHGSQNRGPYQPRTAARNAQSTNPPQRQGEGDSVTQFQEQLGKFAETGKKTFNTFLSKVKAKIQEFDAPSGQGQASGAARPLPGGDSWSTPARSQAYYDPNPPHQGYDVGAPVHYTPSGQSSMPSPGQPTAQPIPSSPELSSSPPTTAGAPTAVDPSKIGLLPRRPVALGSSSQPSRGQTEDDDLEYVENPFEESTRHR